MKKVMLLGAMLAMVLMVGAPAIAQDDDGDDNSVTDNSVNNSGNTSAQYQSQNCTIIIEQYNNAVAGDAIASGDGAVAAVAAEVNAPISVVQQCIQAGGDAVGVVGGGAGVVDGGTDDGSYDDDDVYYSEDGEVVYYDEADDAYYTESGEVVYDVYSSASASDAYSVLPDTGGASLIALGAGALLVAGGLLARRIVR